MSRLEIMCGTDGFCCPSAAFETLYLKISVAVVFWLLSKLFPLVILRNSVE